MATPGISAASWQPVGQRRGQPAKDSLAAAGAQHSPAHDRRLRRPRTTAVSGGHAQPPSPAATHNRRLRRHGRRLPGGEPGGLADVG